jgi:hypothetical protein
MLDVDGAASRGRDSTAQVLYRQLNRMAVWLVSNPSASAAADLAFVLSSLAQHERVVFGSGNTDPEFVPVLCYHLYRLLLDDVADLRDGAMTVRPGTRRLCGRTWLTVCAGVEDSADTAAGGGGGGARGARAVAAGGCTHRPAAWRV